MKTMTSFLFERKFGFAQTKCAVLRLKADLSAIEDLCCLSLHFYLNIS